MPILVLKLIIKIRRKINPVVTFKGQGTYLYGDKTFLSSPSAFDRINVRRLFIVLERAISKAAQFSMFDRSQSPAINNTQCAGKDGFTSSYSAWPASRAWQTISQVPF